MRESEKMIKSNQRQIVDHQHKIDSESRGECQDCPPRDCPLGGNPEVGNPESISYQDCPPQLLCFLCIVCAWYKPWVSARDMGCVFYHDIFIRTIIPEYYKFRIFDNFLVLSFKNSCLPSWPLHWHSVGSWGAQGFRGKQGAWVIWSSRGFWVICGCKDWSWTRLDKEIRRVLWHTKLMFI